MKPSLPARPNLDHLRHQAKTLLASLRSGDRSSAQTLIDHLPAARSMSVESVLRTEFRLADAQSALARMYGFASWPGLARHVELLRAMEGSWTFVMLEVGGNEVPNEVFTNSRILIDGDRFRSETPEGDYEGEFNIDVDVEPHSIDIYFVAGPEAGNTNRGIFEIEGDRLTICLEMSGADRPLSFRTAGSPMVALETLVRSSAERPVGVDGGTPLEVHPVPPTCNEDDFICSDSALTEWLSGEWDAVEVVANGQALPPAFLVHGKRTMVSNEVRVAFGGQLMVHAKVRINETTDPIQVDYFNLGQRNVSYGILSRDEEETIFNMAAPGAPRPTDFTSVAGSNRTMSRWRKGG